MLPGAGTQRIALHENGDYFCRVILASNGIRFVPDAKVFCRIAGSGSLSYIGSSHSKMEGQLHCMRLQIDHLRSLDDSERSRAACVKYLQACLPTFYLERPDLVHEAQQLAAGLGGCLSVPRVSWKYAWIEKLFGFATAKHAQLYYNRVKSSALRAWDMTMYCFDRRSKLPS